jgi:hypothetical protein
MTDSSRPRDPDGVNDGDVPVWSALSRSWEPQPPGGTGSGSVRTVTQTETGAIPARPAGADLVIWRTWEDPLELSNPDEYDFFIALETPSS